MLNEFEFNAKKSLDRLMVTEKSEAAVLEKDVAAALTTFFPGHAKGAGAGRKRGLYAGRKRKNQNHSEALIDSAAI